MTADGELGARGDAALKDLSAARDRLRVALPAGVAEDAAAPLEALWWSLVDAPETGFALIESATELTQVASFIVSRDLVQQNPLADLPQRELITSRIAVAAEHQSRFSRESTVDRLHASGDLLARVVNSSLELGMKEKRCTLPRLVKKLRGRSGCNGLVAALTELRTSEEYLHLAGAKALGHASPPPGSIDATPGEEHPGASLEGLRASAEVLRRLEARALEQLATLLASAHASPPAR